MNEQFTPVQWPESQEYMDFEGFEEHSFLINDEKGLEQYGSGAYMIELKWKSSVDKIIQTSGHPS